MDGLVPEMSMREIASCAFGAFLTAYLLVATGAIAWLAALCLRVGTPLDAGAPPAGLLVLAVLLLPGFLVSHAVAPRLPRRAFVSALVFLLLVAAVFAVRERAVPRFQRS